MKKSNIRIRVIVQVCLIIVSFLLGGLFTLILLEIKPLGVNNRYNIVKDETQVYEKNSLAKSVDKIYNAVVAVEEYESGEINNTGTGFIYKVDDKYGYVLTNEHVLGAAKDIRLLMASNEEISAKVLGKDAYLDLAVLQIDKKYVSMVATIGSSEKMHLGDTVFTVGSPLGINYHGSVTSGILSGKDRMVSTSASNSVNNDWVMRVLQIDAPLNPGNSGGPLLNINGEVVGICSLKLVDDKIEGMGFAIPIEYAMSHVDSLEKGIKIKWPLLGIRMEEVTDSNLQTNGISLSDNIKEGVIVTNVTKGTGADKAGILKGDVITKINNRKIKDVAYLRYELYQYQSGNTIEVTLIRKGKTKTVKVTLTDS